MPQEAFSSWLAGSLANAWQAIRNGDDRSTLDRAMLDRELGLTDLERRLQLRRMRCISTANLW